MVDGLLDGFDIINSNEKWWEITWFLQYMQQFVHVCRFSRPSFWERENVPLLNILDTYLIKGADVAAQLHMQSNRHVLENSCSGKKISKIFKNSCHVFLLSNVTDFLQKYFLKNFSKFPRTLTLKNNCECF